MNNTIALPYYGGKASMLALLYKHFPPHSCFVDVFGGGGSVLLNKPPVPIEVYNDVGFVSTFFRVLRDNAPELIRRLELTPFSREEFSYAVHHVETTTDEIEQARLWFVMIAQSFSHETMPRRSGWKVNKTDNQSARFADRVDTLYRIAQRFRRVVIEHSDFRRMFILYDTPDTLFYLDPPYHLVTRSGGEHYSHELTNNDHCDLLELALSCRGQVVLSGYQNELYQQLLEGWKFLSFDRPNMVVNSHVETSMRTECLWMKQHRLSLWDEL